MSQGYQYIDNVPGHNFKSLKINQNNPKKKKVQTTAKLD